jgi:hypothetical protein
MKGLPDLTRYNRMMLRPLAAIPLITLLLAGCGGNNIRTKDKVQEAILRRLQTSSGLDLKALDFTTTSVRFDKNLAYATVAFHPKNDGNLDSGMTMTYTLEDRGGKWVVVNVGDSQGHQLRRPGSPGPASQLPPGHPPIDSANPHQGSPGQGASGQTQ